MPEIPQTDAEMGQCLSDKQWRKDHLYTIVDESGTRVPFKQREVQHIFSTRRHGCDVILKSRQHGITTEACIDMLDECLFTDDLQCGIIAHTKLDAQQIFDTKIKTPYMALPDFIRDLNPAVKCDAGHLKLANGSSIRVAVSFRSATTHRLHISEYGKICAKYPKRALEIKTGTIPSVHPQLGGRITVESTAEGAAGYFYDLCVLSQADTANADNDDRALNPKQYRFHFYAWWEDPKNRVDAIGVVVSSELELYFVDLAEKGIDLDVEQKAWYALTKDGANGLGKDMKREHPSTALEAFEQSVDGAVYGDELECARSEGRIGFNPWEQDAPVYTAWDLGYGDRTCALFFQLIGSEIRIVDEHGETGRGAQYHAKQIVAKPYGYAKNAHYAPHDIMNHEQGSGVILKDTYAAFGIEFTKVDRIRLKADGIRAVRSIYNKIKVNANSCPELVKAMAFYRFKWDEDLGVFSKDPVHDWASDWMDALQTLALAYKYHIRVHNQLIGYPYPIPACTERIETFNALDFDMNKRRRA